MLNKIITEKYYFGIDIGTQKIKAGILRIKSPSDMELIGAYDHKIFGFKDNAVRDLAEFSECIHDTILELTKKTGMKFKEVQLGLGSAMMEARPTKTVIPLVDRGNKIISSADIKKANHNARLLGIKMDEEILHDLPQYYKVDDISVTLKPLGLYGRKLGVHSLMIVINANLIRNITKAFHEAGYEVVNVFSSSYATSEVVLSDSDKKQGCVLVDLGAQCTTVLVFHDGVLQSMEKISVGGDHLTRSISESIGVPFELAEEIKISYAVTSGSDKYRDEEILVKRDDAYIPVKRGMVCQAIEPIVGEMIERIRMAVTRSGLKDKIGKGMTVVGGGALLPGFIERISESLQMNVKLGQLNLPLRKNLSHTALFSPVIGLAQGGFKKTFQHVLLANNHLPWNKRIVSRVKDLYQEYF